jgi:hypothetical protein
MKASRVAGISAMIVLFVGIAVGQDASHNADKAAVKTGHFVKHTSRKVGHATKTGAKGAGHGSKAAAKDSAKGVKKTGEGIKDAASK